MWKCKILNTDTRVAVKVINLEQAQKNHNINVDDIMTEIELLKELNSPYIMKLTEFKLINGTICLVCEFFEGTELLGILDKHGALNETDSKKII